MPPLIKHGEKTSRAPTYFVAFLKVFQQFFKWIVSGLATILPPTLNSDIIENDLLRSAN